MVRLLVGSVCLFGSSAAMADLPKPKAMPDDLFEVPTFSIESVPPRTSSDYAFAVSFGDMGYWRADVPPWIGFGARATWGRHSGAHRLGLQTSLAVEGPFPIHMSTYLDPHFAWDHVSSKQLQVGLGIGPYVAVHNKSEVGNNETAFGFGPSVAGRIGWSQPFSSVDRRVFVILEPRARWVANGLSPSIALVVGSGNGR